MKREIKFRAWTGISMEYRVMAGYLGAFYVQGLDDKDSASMSQFNTLYTDSVPIMQYTGLKDKNSKEIYEGDIVKTDVRAGNLRVIYFDSYASFILEYKGLLYHLNEGADTEVIGNIYEHDYLLNK